MPISALRCETMQNYAEIAQTREVFKSSSNPVRVAVINWEDLLFPTLTLAPMTKIRFDNGITVTISDGFVQAPSPTLAALLNTLAAKLPGYGGIPFVLDEDFNIAQSLISIVGVGKIVRRDKMPFSRR